MATPSKRLLSTLTVAFALGTAACGSSEPSSAPTTTAVVTTTSTGPTTTSTGPTTTGTSSSTSPPVTTTPSPSEQPATAIWPFASSSTRYDDPVAAARGFAVDFLGFADPVAGTFQQGDSRSGEVEVRSDARGPVTTVLVRQVTADDTWWVIGASAAHIEITEPAPAATIASPVRVSGRSTAFEATVNLEVRADGTAAPIAAGTAMGGSNGEMGPFSATLTFAPTAAARGAIVVKALSAKDGSTLEASVVRMAF